MQDGNNKRLASLAGALLAVGVLATALPNLIVRFGALSDDLADSVIAMGWVALLMAMGLLVVLARRVSMDAAPGGTAVATGATQLRSSR